MNLLETFSLINTQVVAMHAERLGDPGNNQPLHAKVDLSLTPRELTHQTDGLANYQIQAQLKVTGYCGQENGPDRVDVFIAETKWVAEYRQFQGERLSFETFSEHHPLLGRQLYPLMHVHLMTVLQQLGVGYVQLPIDLTHLQSAINPGGSLPAGYRAH